MKYCVRYRNEGSYDYLTSMSTLAWRSSGCSFQGDGHLCPKNHPDIQVFESKELAERWVKRRKAWMKARGRTPDKAMCVEEYP